MTAAFADGQMPIIQDETGGISVWAGECAGRPAFQEGQRITLRGKVATDGDQTRQLHLNDAKNIQITGEQPPTPKAVEIPQLSSYYYQLVGVKNVKVTEVAASEFYVEDAQRRKLLIYTGDVRPAYSPQDNLKAGDVLNISGIAWPYLGENEICPRSPEDIQLTADELTTAKEEAKNTLDNYKKPADYRQAQKDELTAAITAGKAAIGKATDVDAVNSALAAAKAELDKIKTDAQLTAEELAEELAAAKTAAQKALDSYKNPADYRQAQKTELAATITAGKTAIGKATDVNAVNSALAAAKAELDKIKTDAQLTAEEIKLSEDKTVTIEITDSSILSQDVLKAIKDSGKEVTFVKKDKNGKVLYSWTFDGGKIGDKIQNIDLKISFTTDNKAAIDKLAGDKNSVYLSFAYEGKLPAPALIRVYVGDKYKDGDNLNLYYFNAKTKQAEEIATGLTVKDGYVSFTLTHLSDYFLTENKISQNESENGDKKENEKTKGPATGDRSSLAIWSLICGAGIIAAAYLLLRKKHTT